MFTHPSRIFPHTIDSGNPIITFSVSNLHIIAAPTEVKVLPSSSSSATSTSAIPVSQTHLWTINPNAQTWCTRNWVPERPGFEYILPKTRSASNLRIDQEFISLTTSSRQMSSMLLVNALWTEFNSKILQSGLRTSSPSYTCSWTNHQHLSVFVPSSMITFIYCDVSQAGGLIYWHSWNSPRCLVFHRHAHIGTNIYLWNTIESVHSLTTFIDMSIIPLPTILLTIYSSTLVRTFHPCPNLPESKYYQ